jgi:hypothetical protein
MKPRFVHLVLLLALAGAIGAVLTRGRQVREDRAVVLAALRDARGPALPAVGRSGARSASEPARYDADTLYELINGAAEAYLARGFEECIASTFAFATPAGEVEVAAEVHRFGEAAGARVQLEAERPRRGAPVDGVVGANGAVSDGSVLLVVSGRDLLKLTRLDMRPDGGEVLVALAVAWLEERKP